MSADTATTPGRWSWASLAPALPYAGVLSGLYLLGSGWAAIVGYHLAMCCVLTIARSWAEGAALVRGWHTLFGLGMCGLCATSGALVFVLWPVIHLGGVSMSGGLAAVGLEGWPWLAFIAYYSLVNPWLEELFWRGWYPMKLGRPLVADVLFAGYHVFVLVLFVQLSWSLVAFGVLVAVAFIWRCLARKHGGLLIAVISHMVADVSVIAAVYLLATR